MCETNKSGEKCNENKNSEKHNSACKCCWGISVFMAIMIVLSIVFIVMAFCKLSENSTVVIVCTTVIGCFAITCCSIALVFCIRALVACMKIEKEQTDQAAVIKALANAYKEMFPSQTGNTNASTAGR